MILCPADMDCALAGVEDHQIVLALPA